MKYGLIVYPESDNLGDHILSYAAIRFLPRIDYIVDREHLDTFCPDEKELVAVIMNGWYLYNKFNWPPSPYLNPLILGTHFSDNVMWGIKDQYLDGEGSNYLKTHGPVGCRDVSTREKMETRDIPSYFSGCLTLTLKQFPDAVKHNKIVLVDIPDMLKQKVQAENRQDEVAVISHHIDLNERYTSWEKQKAAVEKNLRFYQGARLVITSRLHCALPCLALGTPVILITNDSEDFARRMGTYTPYLHCYTAESFMKEKFDWLCPAPNSDKFHTLRDALIKTCTDFMIDAEAGKENKAAFLPEVQEFRAVWKNKIEWQNCLLNQDTITMGRAYYDELISANRWLGEQYQHLTQRIADLEGWVKELEQGKAWLEQHAAEQEKYIQELKHAR